MGTLLPERVSVKLPYINYFRLDPGTADYAEFLTSTNSVYDPDISSGGRNQQPRGMDQWAALYDRYQVTKFSCLITGNQATVAGDPSTPEVSPYVVGSAIVSDRYTPTPLTGLQTQILNVMEAPYQAGYIRNHYKLIVATTNAQSYSNQYRRRITIDPVNTLKYFNPNINQSGYSSNFPAISQDPGFPVPLVVYLGTAYASNAQHPEWVFMLRCFYTVTFCQPINMGTS